jgi:hypothetical protein
MTTVRSIAPVAALAGYSITAFTPKDSRLSAKLAAALEIPRRK